MALAKKWAAVGGVASMSAGVFFVYIGWMPLPLGLMTVMLIMAGIHAIRKREGK